MQSDAPAEAPRSAANHLQAADSAVAHALPAAEKGQAQPLDDTLPITPPQIQTNRTVPSSRSSTAGSDNGEIPVTFTQNRLGNVTTQQSYERGTFNNGTATPAFQDSYGNSRQVSESTSREDPWVRVAISMKMHFPLDVSRQVICDLCAAREAVVLALSGYVQCTLVPIQSIMVMWHLWSGITGLVVAV